MTFDASNLLDRTVNVCASCGRAYQPRGGETPVNPGPGDPGRQYCTTCRPVITEDDGDMDSYSCENCGSTEFEIPVRQTEYLQARGTCEPGDGMFVYVYYEGGYGDADTEIDGSLTCAGCGNLANDLDYELQHA